jgi:hypothetical protein
MWPHPERADRRDAAACATTASASSGAAHIPSAPSDSWRLAARATERSAAFPWLRHSRGRAGRRAPAIAPVTGGRDRFRRKAVTALLPRQVTAMDEGQASRVAPPPLSVLARSGSAGRFGPEDWCSFLVLRQLQRRSVALAVGQRVRHSLRRGGRPLDVWKADRTGARRGGELDAVDLDVVALTRALEHVVERAASVAERVGPVGNDDRRLELHTHSIARPGLTAASSRATT